LYNGWSLSETTLSQAIEQTGQAIDITTEANQWLASHFQRDMGMFLKEYDIGKLLIHIFYLLRQ
jgi:hypothetical protein